MFCLEILTLGFFANIVSHAICERYVNHAEAGQLKRYTGGEDFAYVNLVEHKFHYLNITSLTSMSVKDFQECVKNCLVHSSCYSFNRAVLPDIGQTILCELLPSDKYKKSSTFSASPKFHHYSIKVRKLS